jgi:predicted RNA binding protein YcfA (HicA-like mRNA interferase family)
MDPEKTLAKAVSGSRNIRFADLVNLSKALGFDLSRVSGSHHIFKHPDVDELLNLQDVRGKAKTYQVRQLLRLIEKYDLRLKDDE